jgi:ATP-dependent Clp protease ATP-binding subunit ClpA
VPSDSPAFDRLTDRVRKILDLANIRAISMQRDRVDTEHVLLAIFAEGTGIAVRTLRKLKIDSLKITLDVERIAPSGTLQPTNPTDELPHSIAVERAIGFAIEESRALNHDHVGSEHLLLGLMRETGGIASEVLRKHRLTIDQVRTALLEQLKNRFERFTYRARKIVALANQQAIRMHRNQIDTEHVLLGIVVEGSSLASQVLKHLKVDLRKIESEVERIAPKGPDVIATGKLPQSLAFKRAIEFSVFESEALNHDYVGTEHLLLGLLREFDGIASQVLRSFHLQLPMVRSAILDILTAPPH